MSTNSRSKGKRGELEWAAWLRDNLGLDARRGQQFHGGGDSPDVVGGIPGTHAEVKRVEALNLSKAMAQAVGDCAAGSVPYVAHRRNRGEWMVTLRASDAERFSECVCIGDGLSPQEMAARIGLALPGANG